MNGAGFHRPDTILIMQPVVLQHWREFDALASTRESYPQTSPSRDPIATLLQCEYSGYSNVSTLANGQTKSKFVGDKHANSQQLMSIRWGMIHLAGVS